MAILAALAAGSGCMRGADTDAARKKSGEHLLAIMKVSVVTAADNSDRWPDRASALFVRGFLGPEILANPRIGKQVIDITKADFAAAAQAERDARNAEMEAMAISGDAKRQQERRAIIEKWHALSDGIEEKCDYVLGTAGVAADPYGRTDLGTLVIAWEKPQGLKDGINIIFGDWKVQFVPLADLPKVFELNNTLRRDKGFPEIALKDGLPVAGPQPATGS